MGTPVLIEMDQMIHTAWLMKFTSKSLIVQITVIKITYCIIYIIQLIEYVFYNMYFICAYFKAMNYFCQIINP